MSYSKAALYRHVLTGGFAMFSMFFGSGNLVFPLIIGVKTYENPLHAIYGLLITAVLLPFFGLFGIMHYRGDHTVYFSILGPYSRFLLSLLMLGLMGPFGVIPRCISVAFGGVHLLYPTLPLWVFSLIFAVLCVALCGVAIMWSTLLDIF
jgi:LIVCS family branched-chain amino acid:cation transporter